MTSRVSRSPSCSSSLMSRSASAAPSGKLVEQRDEPIGDRDGVRGSLAVEVEELAALGSQAERHRRQLRPPGAVAAPSSGGYAAAATWRRIARSRGSRSMNARRPSGRTACPPAPDLAGGLLPRQRLPVGAVARHRVERVGDGEDAGAERDVGPARARRDSRRRPSARGGCGRRRAPRRCRKATLPSTCSPRIGVRLDQRAAPPRQRARLLQDPVGDRRSCRRRGAGSRTRCSASSTSAGSTTRASSIA